VAPERLHVAYSCIDGSRFDNIDGLALRKEFGITNGSPVIGNVGHMVDHKGQEYLVDAMPRVLRNFPDARFFIVGEGKLKKKLEARAESLGVNGSLYTPGFRPDVPDFMGMFDVFVMPSKMEGLGTSVLDALAAGKPVVASRTGGIPEMIQHERNGILVQPCNPDDLARGIMRVLGSPREATKFAREGKKLAREKFSIDSLVRDTLKIYHLALRGRKGGGG
jgi:glycosyltransferase involved in cell wall biosynthesis